MRYPPEHKEEVRRGIIAAAASALRVSGVDGVSIPKLMKLAGLTHGGFYAHFEDRDDLVARAVEAGHDTMDRVFAPAPNIAALLEGYVSQAHVDHPEQGCVVAALGAEARRQPKKTRRAFGYAANGLIRLVSDKLGKSPTHDLSLVLTAAMVGAVVLARAIDDPKLAERVLDATRRMAKKWAD